MYRLRDGFAFALWVYIVTKIGIFDVDREVVQLAAPKLLWLLNFKFVFLLLLFAASLYFLKYARFAQATLYILFFPAILLLWKIPRRLGAHWPFTIAFAPALFDYFIDFKTNTTILATAIFSAFLIFSFQDTQLVLTGIIIMGCLLLVYLVRSLGKAYKSTVFSGLTRQVLKLQNSIRNGKIAGLFSPKTPTPPQPIPSPATTSIGTQPAQQAFDSLTIIYISKHSLDFIGEKVQQVAKSKKIDLFLLSNVLIVTFNTIVCFSILYYGLNSLDPHAFTGPKNPTYWGFLGFSFNNFTTANVSPISAGSVTAQIFSHLETFSALVVVTILVFTILTVAREKYQEDIASFTDALKATSEVITEQLNKKLRFTLDNLEDTVLNQNVTLVNFMRKINQKPPLDAPKNMVSHTLVSPNPSPTSSKQTRSDNRSTKRPNTRKRK